MVTFMINQLKISLIYLKILSTFALDQLNLLEILTHWKHAFG